MTPGRKKRVKLEKLGSTVCGLLREMVAADDREKLRLLVVEQNYDKGVQFEVDPAGQILMAVPYAEMTEEAKRDMVKLIGPIPIGDNSLMVPSDTVAEAATALVVVMRRFLGLPKEAGPFHVERLHVDDFVRLSAEEMKAEVRKSLEMMALLPEKNQPFVSISDEPTNCTVSFTAYAGQPFLLEVPSVHLSDEGKVMMAKQLGEMPEGETSLLRDCHGVDDAMESMLSMMKDGLGLDMMGPFVVTKFLDDPDAEPN